MAVMRSHSSNVREQCLVLQNSDCMFGICLKFCDIHLIGEPNRFRTRVQVQEMLDKIPPSQRVGMNGKSANCTPL